MIVKSCQIPMSGRSGQKADVRTEVVASTFAELTGTARHPWLNGHTITSDEEESFISSQVFIVSHLRMQVRIKFHRDAHPL